MRTIKNLSSSVQGIVCLLLALVCLTVSDAIIKWLSSTYPLHQITLARGTVALALVLTFAHLYGGLSQLRTQRLKLHLLRGMLLVLANIFFFLGLSVMPMATTVTLFYCGPFFICLLARIVLGEPVGAIRWLAISIGMSGVIVIADPGSGDFSWSVGLPILAALTYSLMVMLTRKLAVSDSASSMSFYIQVCFVCSSVIIGLSIGHGHFNVFDQPTLDFLLRAWLWLDPGAVQLLFGCGLASAAGAYLLSQSYRVAHASVVAPFEYCSLPMAIAVGLIVWGDIPIWRDCFGSLLIVGSGLSMVYFESHKRRKLAA